MTFGGDDVDRHVRMHATGHKVTEGEEEKKAMARQGTHGDTMINTGVGDVGALVDTSMEDLFGGDRPNIAETADRMDPIEEAQTQTDSGADVTPTDEVMPVVDVRPTETVTHIEEAHAQTDSRADVTPTDEVMPTVDVTPTEAVTHTEETGVEEPSHGSTMEEPTHGQTVEEGAHIDDVLGDDLGADEEGPGKTKKKKPRGKKTTKEVDPRNTARVPKEGPFPGGPGNCHLLKSFYDHIALMIWIGEERPALKPIHHTKNLKSWNIDDMPAHFHARLNATGLQVLSYALPVLNRCLISAFIERWHRETSSFHLPLGEMTITLDDVKQITGLNIQGEPLTNYEIGEHWDAVRLVERTLGLGREEVRNEFKANLNQYVLSIKWLREKMQAVELYKDAEISDPSEEGKKKVDYVVRGYLLYSLGCTLFADKSGSRVSVYYLKYLEDLDKVKNYAWGASGLGFLYDSLSNASHHAVRQIDGFLSLLEVWVYEHIAPLRGKIAMGYDESQPRMKRWSHSAGASNKEGTLIELRQRLDNLGPQDIIWDPYKNLRSSTRPVDEISFYEGLLSYIGTAPARVPYMPNRVLRQFGYIQHVPVDPAEHSGDYFTQWCNHVVDPRKRVLIKEGQSDHVTSYMLWYVANSHRKVQNPLKWVEYAASSGPARDTPMDTQVDDDTFRFWVRIGFQKLADTIAKGKRHCGGPGYNVLKEAVEDFLKSGPSILEPPIGGELEQEAEETMDEQEEEDYHVAEKLQNQRATKKRKVGRAAASRRIIDTPQHLERLETEEGITLTPIVTSPDPVSIQPTSLQQQTRRLRSKTVEVRDLKDKGKEMQKDKRNEKEKDKGKETDKEKGKRNAR